MHDISQPHSRYRAKDDKRGLGKEGVSQFGAGTKGASKRSDLMSSTGICKGRGLQQCSCHRASLLRRQCTSDSLLQARPTWTGRALGAQDAKEQRFGSRNFTSGGQGPGRSP